MSYVPSAVRDPPFAATERWSGLIARARYCILDCPDLDEALKHAVRLPMACYGSIEVRPIMDMNAIPAPR
jgi:hypothetical protein